MSRKRSNSLSLSLFLLIFLSLSGCETPLKKDMRPGLADLKSIAVIPFVCMDCTIPFPGTTLKMTETTSDGNASAIMTEYLVEKLKTKDGLNVVLMPEMRKEDIEPLYSGLFKLEKVPVSDAVCIGRIYNYKERRGGNYSVSEPASVAFDMRIIRVSDGQVLFACDFDETQKPLSSNIMNIRSFLKRKGRWIKAEEMALSAMDEALKEFIENKP